MKKFLIYYLFITLSICVNTCSDGFKEEATETYKFTIKEVTAVPSTTNNTTPDYVFNANMAGTITYGGSCSSSTTSVISGNNTITLATLSDGTYSDCTITVTNQQLNLKSSLTITSFTVDTTAPTITEVTAVPNPSYDNISLSYIFSSNEAGTITYGGSCSSSDTSATTDNNTITLASLSAGTYSDCTITVTDTAGNATAMNMSSFFMCCVQMGGSLQGAELSLTATKEVTTLAGTGPPSGSTDNPTGTLAKFYQPFDITTDGTNLYVADTKNHTIRQVVISTGAVTTLAGTAGSSGKIDNSTGTGASFKTPKGITTDGTNLYVADQQNHLIRQIVISTGAVTTLAGSSAGYSDNPTGTSAQFSSPCGITTDGTNVYVADTFNYRIRQIVIDNGTVTTLAGSGSAGSADNDNGSLASFDRPYGITTDGTNLFVADSFNDKIRKIVIETRVVTTLAGTGLAGEADNDNGLSASFDGAFGITTDGTNLYVADRGNNKIRKIGIDNRSVTTLAGTGTGGRANGAGSDATFKQPAGITTDGYDLYVITQGNHLIRKID